MYLKIFNVINQEIMGNFGEYQCPLQVLKDVLEYIDQILDWIGIGPLRVALLDATHHRCGCRL